MRFIHPLDDHTLTRGFHFLSSLYVLGKHAAADYIRRLAATCGSPIKVVADGVVVGVGWGMYSGFFVAVDHAGGWRSFYRHLFGQTPVVVGQYVAQGQIIGNIGNTGASLGDHLHFDLWHPEKKDPTAFYKNGWWAHDPELYLGKEDDAMTDAQLATLLKAMADHSKYLEDRIHAVHEEAKRLHVGNAKYLEDRIHAVHQETLNALAGLPIGGGPGGLKRGDSVILK